MLSAIGAYMDRYSLAIIGGGFSGLCLNAMLDERLKKKTVIFERLDRVGKKILATGNGRGNFSNEDLSAENYHGKDPSFVGRAIKTYDNKAITRFFAKLGVPFTVENGRIYPQSLQANALLDALRLSAFPASVKTGEKVASIERIKGGFIVRAENYSCFAENVALCAGGASAENFGTDGSAYALALPFGHKVTELFPSLVRIKVASAAAKGLKGVKLPSKVGIFDGEKKLAETSGDILFGDNFISGNTAFYLSSFVHGLKDPKIIADLIPEKGEEEIVGALSDRVKRFPQEPSSFLLSGVVHSALSNKIARELLPNKKLKDIKKADIINVFDILKNYKINICGVGTFDISQVTHGGIETSDVCDDTMMSKLCPDLYFCGEILDIDGDCGGYNLQWAFSSASAVARQLNERYSDR